MTRKVEPRNSEHIRQGQPLNATFAETCPRWVAFTDNALQATGVGLAVGVPLQVGDVVSNISFVTGATAAGTPTAGYVALYSPAGVLLGASVDQTTTARAANTAYTIALAAAVTITAACLYYVGISFTATTVPTVWGTKVGNAAVAGAMGLTVPSTPKILAQSHGTALGGTAPATIATPTTVATIPYLVCT